MSTVKQGEGVSLEAQRTAIERFAASHGITITRWFEELETAAKTGRPFFNQMVKELRRCRADGVVMHRVDRSARNFADWAKIGELADAGIDVHFATESLDFNSRGGRLSADIQAVIAADYIRNLREEVRKGINGRLEQGLYPARAPVGYVDNGGGQPKTLDPIRAPLVKRAFELYATGQYPIRSLCAEMNQLGLRSHTGGPISKTSLEKMLNNPFYAGVIRVKRTGATYRGIHEPLVSVRLFETVQAVKAGKTTKKVTRHNHAYRGLFRCGGCGLSMIPERQKGHIYYRCQRAECPTNSIWEEAIETAVATILDRVSLNHEAAEAIVTLVTKLDADNGNVEAVRSYSLQLANLKAKLDRLSDALVDRLIDEEMFKVKQERLLLQQVDLEERLERERRERITPHMTRRFLERLKNLAEHYIFAPPDEKREIVQITTSNRTVWNKKVCVEPSNWVKIIEQLIPVPDGGPSRATSRRRHKFSNQQIQALMTMMRSEECREGVMLRLELRENGEG